MDALFSNFYNDVEKIPLKKRYKFFLAENTPWIIDCILLCIEDLSNINQVATGSHDHKIRLWDLMH